MAVQKIQYENKEALKNDLTKPRKNKVVDEDMNSIKEVVNNNADELTTAQQNIKNLQSGQNTANGDITSLKNRVNTLETDNSTNKTDINTLKADNETNKQNIQSLQSDNTTNKANINTLLSDNETNKQNIEDLQTDNETNKTNIANKVDKVEGKGLSTEDFTSELKAKLEGLSNYDDAEIKEDIAEIQAEQTTQNQKIEQLDDNQIHIETEQSSTINVQDCSNLSAKIDVFGVSSQETRSGKNKFDIEKLTGNNITNKDSETGSFTMSNCWATTIMNNASLQELLKSNTQYKCIADVTLLSKPENLNTANTNQILSLYNKQDLIVTNILSTSTKQEKDDWEVNTTKHLNVTFTTPNNLTGFEVIGYNYRTNNSTNEGSFKFENIMILEVTEDDETFEQYGASPSPEFPSEIENVTGNIEITVCNKNLYENIEDGYINTTTGQNQTSTINKRSVGNILLSKNEQLKLIRYDNNKGIRFYYYELNGDYIESSVSSSVSELNTNVYNREVLLRYVLMNTMSDEDIKCMLCNINSNSDYIEHEEQIIIFPLSEGQKMYDGDYLADDGIHHVRTQDNNVSGTSKTFSNAKENGKYMCNVKESGTLNGKTITFGTSVTNAIVEYELAEEETEAYTEAQQEAYDQLQNVTPYKLVTNVFTDKAKLQFNYIADTKTYIDNKVTNMQKQLNTINELLSTANTSAMLLDNLQTDLESEVL